MNTIGTMIFAATVAFAAVTAAVSPVGAPVGAPSGPQPAAAAFQVASR